MQISQIQNQTWQPPHYLLDTIGDTSLSSCEFLNIQPNSKINNISISLSSNGISAIFVNTTTNNYVVGGAVQPGDMITNWQKDPSSPNSVIGFNALVNAAGI